MRRPQPVPEAENEAESETELRSTAAATLVASAGLFVGMLLIPGVLPRYVLPLTIPLALGAAVFIPGLSQRSRFFWHRTNQILAGLAVAAALIAPIAAALLVENDGEKWRIVGYDWRAALPAIGASSIAFLAAGFLWSRRAVMLSSAYLAISSAAVFGVVSLLFGVTAPRYITMQDDLRPLGARINKSIPAGAELVIVDPGYHAALFYLTCRTRYAAEIRDIPPGAEFVLVRSKDAGKVRRKRPEYVGTFDYKRKGESEFVLLQPLAGVPGK